MIAKASDLREEFGAEVGALRLVPPERVAKVVGRFRRDDELARH
jgi:hypothetical protein